MPVHTLSRLMHIILLTVFDVQLLNVNAHVLSVFCDDVNYFAVSQVAERAQLSITFGEYNLGLAGADNSAFKRKIG